MEKLIEKKIKALIPESKEREFDIMIGGFEDIYLDNIKQESVGDGVILRRKLLLDLVSSKIIIT